MLLEEFLTDLGYAVNVVADGHQALECLKRESFSGVLTDLKMAKLEGIELLKTIKLLYPSLPVVMITGYPSVESAVEAMKEGAADFITKPLRLDELRLVISRITRIHASQYADSTSVAISSPLAAAIPPLLPGKVKELSILYGISEAFQPDTDSEGIFQGLVQVAVEIASAYSSSFTMVDPISNKSILKACHGCDQNNQFPVGITFQEDLLDRLRREQKPILFNNSHEGVILPVISKNRLLGALYVWDKQNNLPFTKKKFYYF